MTSLGLLVLTLRCSGAPCSIISVFTEFHNLLTHLNGSDFGRNIFLIKLLDIWKIDYILFYVPEGIRKIRTDVLFDIFFEILYFFYM